MPPAQVEQSLDNLKLERDAIVLYDSLAAIEKDPHRAEAFRRIAGNERRHADIWAAKLRETGAKVPEADGPRLRVRFIILAARVLGTAAVAELVKALEGDEEEAYDQQGGSPELAAIAADEREHAVIWDRLKTSGQAGEVGEPGRDGVAIARRARSAAEVGQRETWHRAGGRSGTLRAVIFGVSDGLVSNLSLVMGVAGAASANPSFHPAGRDRGPAGRIVQHGRRRVHLDAEPARAVRAPDRARARRDGSDARGGGGRARGVVPGQGVHRRPRPPGSPTASSRTRQWPSTTSSARSSASTPTNWGRRGAPRSVRSWPSRSGRRYRSCPICSVAG